MQLMNLGEFRQKRGLSQAALAKLAGLRQATISEIEAGRANPRAKTVKALADALDMRVEELEVVLRSSSSEVLKTGDFWAFLEGLDTDLRRGLLESLVAHWTHSSTALEGNTISLGDTLFILREGLTISGKSLIEHEEVTGHAEALRLLSQFLKRGARQLKASDLHQLHRAVQTGVVIDSLAPVGRWKVEQNGTMAILSTGDAQWHEYAAPRAVNALMEQWLADFTEQKVKASAARAVEIFTDVHLGFTAIHPYADGNGRMARLLANVPVLASGQPPLLVRAERRGDYIRLLGDYTVKCGSPKVGETLVLQGKERDALIEFFQAEWQPTQDMVQDFWDRQKKRKQ